MILIFVAVLKIQKNGLSINVFSSKILIEDTIFKSPTGDGTAILCGHLSHVKVQLFAGQRELPSFLSYLKTLSIGQVPGVEPTTSCSAFKRSTN